MAHRPPTWIGWAHSILLPRSSYERTRDVLLGTARGQHLHMVALTYRGVLGSALVPIRVAMEEEGGDRFDVHGTCACRIAGAHSLRRLEQQVGCRQCGRHVLVAELCQAQAWRSAADGRRSGYPVAVRTREHARRACLLDGEDGFGSHLARSDGAQPHIVSIHFPKRTSVTVRTKIRISPTRPDPGSTFPYT